MAFPILPLLVVLFVAWLSGRAAERVGYPAVLGELAAGILLGPPLLGWIEGHASLDVLSEVGILLMMAYIGMEIDRSELRKASRGGLLAAVGGFATPFALCYGLIVWSGGTPLAASFVGMAAGVTALATKSRILLDLKLLDTRLASVMLAGALVTDTVSLVFLAGILGVARTGAVDFLSLAIIAAKAIAFFAAAAAAGQFGFPVLGRLVSRTGPLSANAAFIVAVLATLLFAEVAELAGMHGILGAFVAGIFLRDRLFGRQLTRSVESGLKQASLGFLAPIFFVTAGFDVSLGVLFDTPGLLLGLLFLATAGKIVGTALFYLGAGHGWREGIVIGAGMNGRGAVEIVIAQIGLSLGLITQDIFSILVFMAIFTTATVPVFMRWGVTWLDRRGELVRSADGRTGTLVVGAGPTARAFAALLARTGSAGSVRLLDRNTEACAAARALGLDVVEGDAMDEDVLASAGAASVRNLLALTPNPAVNALVSRVAQSAFRVPHILVHHEGRWTASGTDGGRAEHESVLEHTGASTAFGTPFHLSDWDYWFENGRTDLETRHLDAPSDVADTVRRLGGQALALLAEREGVAFPVSAATHLQAGDRLTIVRRHTDAAPDAGTFREIIASAPVVVDAGPIDRAALLDLAAGRLSEITGIPSSQLSAAFQDREESGSTVIAEGIAVPHGHLPGVGRVAVVVVRSREGIRFPDLSAPVHAAFVIATSDDRRTEYLRTLASIARAVSLPGFMERWMGAADAEELRGMMLRG